MNKIEHNTKVRFNIGKGRNITNESCKTKLGFTISSNKEKINIFEPLKLSIKLSPKHEKSDNVIKIINSILCIEKKFVSLPDFIYKALLDKYIYYDIDNTQNNITININPDSKFLEISKDLLNSLIQFGLSNKDEPSDFNFSFKIDYLSNKGLLDKLKSHCRHNFFLSKHFFDKGISNVKLLTNKESANKFDKFLRILLNDKYTVPNFSMFKKCDLNLKVDLLEKDIKCNEFDLFFVGLVDSLFDNAKAYFSSIDEQS